MACALHGRCPKWPISSAGRRSPFEQGLQPGHRSSDLLPDQHSAPTEVAVGQLKTPSVVAANLVMTMDWTQRKAKKEAKADSGVLENVLQRLLPLIGAERLFAK